MSRAEGMEKTARRGLSYGARLYALGSLPDQILSLSFQD
jgi:hypothetical protein